MEYGNLNTLVCIDNTKDACLYFNEVIPLNLGHIIPWEGNGDLEAHQILQKILPNALLDASKPFGVTSPILSYIEAYVNVFPESIGIESPSEEEIKKRVKHFFPLLMQKKDELFSSLMKPVNTIFGTSKSQDQVEDPALILTGLKLIDTSQIQWRQIIEIREDKESIAKLRRLRTFIYQNYNDKPISYIQDDLLNRIEIYETTSKQLGLKTVDSSLKIIFNSGTVIANTVATIASIIYNEPIAISLSLGVSSAFFLGNVGLEFRSYKRDLFKFKQENPITYLIDIKGL